MTSTPMYLSNMDILLNFTQVATPTPEEAECSLELIQFTQGI